MTTDKAYAKIFILARNGLAKYVIVEIKMVATNTTL